MPIFFKKKRGNLEENGFARNGSDYFKDAIEKRKMKVAGWLNQKTAGYSPLQKRVVLAIFCILFGASSFYILSGCIRDHGFRRQPVVLQHLRSGMPVRPAYPVTDSLFRQAEKTRLWLDSIRRNDSLKFKAILLARPYLLDNVQLIERIYQFKTR